MHLLEVCLLGNIIVPSRPRALTKVKVKDTVGPIEGPEEGG